MKQESNCNWYVQIFFWGTLIGQVGMNNIPISSSFSTMVSISLYIGRVHMVELIRTHIISSTTRINKASIRLIIDLDGQAHESHTCTSHALLFMHNVSHTTSTYATKLLLLFLICFLLVSCSSQSLFTNTQVETICGFVLSLHRPDHRGHGQRETQFTEWTVHLSFGLLG